MATPILLGAIIGAIATGKVADRPSHLADLFRVWIAPFPIAVGLFTLAIFTFLAAVYLTLETDDCDLRDDFRRRALIAAVAVGAMAWVVYLLARREAPLVYDGLADMGLGRIVRIATGFVAILAILALVYRYYQLARLSAGLQVVLILWGCAMAQRPYLVPPRWSISTSAAPDATLRTLLVALLTGSVVLIPSILYLFRIFKRHTLERTGELSPEPK